MPFFIQKTQQWKDEKPLLGQQTTKNIYQNADNKAGQGSFEAVIKHMGCAYGGANLQPTNDKLSIIYKQSLNKSRKNVYFR